MNNEHRKRLMTPALSPLPPRPERMRPSKRLGQHFLVSDAVLAKIIAAADLAADDTVLEIGAGTGVLTRALAARAGAVVAVEKDPELCRSLERDLKKTGIANVRLTRGDILKIPFDELGLPERYAVVANIPYYLTSRLIRKLLEAERPPSRILLTVQQEVAERITANPPDMNLLAVAVQAYAKPELLFTIPAGAFSPRPNVDSALIRIAGISKRFFETHRIGEEEFFSFVRHAFQHRRKQLASSLRPLFPSQETRSALAAIGLPPTARPQELTPERWAILLQVLRGSPPTA